MKPILCIILILGLAVQAGAGEVDYYKSLPKQQKESYILVCEKGMSLCTQYDGTEILSILERAKKLYEHQDAMQFCNMPRTTLDYRPCPEPLERDYEYKLFKDIEAMIKRLK